MNIDQFYRNILENLPQAVLAASVQPDPETGKADFLVEYVNPSWESVSGAQIKTIQGKLLSKTLYASSSIPWMEYCSQALSTAKPVHHIMYSDLVEKWLDITMTMLDEAHVCCHVSDVSDLKQGETRLKAQNLRLSSLSAELTESRNNLKVKLEKIESLNVSLERLAYYDRLTNLPNRIKFQQTLLEEIANASRAETKFAVAIFDIDNLKTLNDSIGHDSGDELLRQIAQRLGHFSMADVMASRFGGDEFLLIAHNYEGDAELLHLIGTIQETLREPYMIHNAEIRTTVSIGVATYPEDATTDQELLKYADIAMTDAKRRGKNTLSLFHSIMQENLLSRLNMEHRMLATLEREGFRLFYQPQYDANTKGLRGFEALIRWFDEELGYVSPEKFIPIAEENRTIIPLGDWILREACKALKDWQDRFGFAGIVSVNVSPVQLQQSGFIDDLRDVISSTGIKPSFLEIEITEGVLIRNFEESIRLLQEIRGLGVALSLDDFGTGYSSLRYLQYLPINTLKIDKSFIANITAERSIEYDITDAIVNLVNRLGLDTIAEGVETDAQFETMKKLNCKTIQGFLTGRPMPKEECDGLIERDSCQ
ncbi:MAG TPA: EAL domain-containing protein [Treponemataceae bacterium]|nr:EAL domain-containing protein [Treponemataceae bacterium]